MTKISLLNQIIDIKIFTDGEVEPKPVNIKNGVYRDRQYASLVVWDETMILEGDNILMITDKAKIIDIKISSIKDMIAEKLGSNSVYLDKIDAIPIGMEREILDAVIL